MIIPDSSTWKHLFCIGPLFVRGTTLYISMSDLLFGYVFSSFLQRKPTMFTVLCRNAQSGWQSRKSYIM